MLETAAIDQRQPAAPPRGRAGQAPSDPFALLLGNATAESPSPPSQGEPASRVQPGETPRSAKAAAAESKPQAPRKPRSAEADDDAADTAAGAQATATATAATQPTVDAAIDQGLAASGATANDAATGAADLAGALAQGAAATSSAGGQGSSATNQATPQTAANPLGTTPPGLEAPTLQSGADGQPGPAAPGETGPAAAEASAQGASNQTLPEQASAAAAAAATPQVGARSAAADNNRSAAESDQQTAKATATPATPAVPATPAQPATPAAAGQPATPAVPAQPATPAIPAQRATPPEQAASTADPTSPEVSAAGRGAPTVAPVRPGTTGNGPAGQANTAKPAGKAAGQQTAAQRAEALAERLASSSAAERDFQAYLQRVAAGDSQSTQAPVADDGAPQGLPAQQQAANAADAPLSAATARPVPTTPGTQIALQVHSALTSRLQRFSIRLEPAELGRVDVRLEFHRDGHVRATIAAERRETLDLLQRDIHSLERALRDSGTNTAKLSFNFDLQDGGQHGSRFADHQASNGSADRTATDVASVTDEPAADADAPLRRVDGLIDIKV